MSKAKKMPMQTPQDLFVHELSDLHSAEQMIVAMLEEAQGLVQNPHLKEGLRMHAEQSRQHAARLEQAFQQLGARPHPIECHAVKGLHQELREALKAEPSPQVLEGLVVSGASKTEHYEISAYMSLIDMARTMGQTEIARTLEQNLLDEQQMLQQVEQIGRQMMLQMASMAGMQPGQQAEAVW
ncbi:MAG TPA: DUF892 family protein [Thermomicrobiales bacterium]